MVFPTPTNGPSPTPTTTITPQACDAKKGEGKFRQVNNAISGQYIVVLQSDVPAVEGAEFSIDEQILASLAPNTALLGTQSRSALRVDAQQVPAPIADTTEQIDDGPSPIPTDPPPPPLTPEEQIVAQTAADLTTQYGGSYERVYAATLRGFSALLSEDQARAMSEDSRVEYIEENALVSLSAVASWGLDRIDQRNRPLDQNYHYDTDGRNVNVYVIDSGLRATHQDFGGRATMAANFTGDNQFTDCNGHGTHVSGTIGGNTHGVAKGVRLYGVKVLNCSGSGDIAGIIAGINYVAQNRPKNVPAVANMSIGMSANSAVDDSVRNLIKSGVTAVAAAGNDTRDASLYSPARVCEAITVGATDYLDNRAEFSNFGPVLDLFAPGADIVSTWNASDTATNVLDGTSMAAPHVTGVVARYLQTHQTATPAQVGAAITGNATSGILVNNNIGPGSPNLLLYSSWDNSPTNGCSNPIGDHAVFDGMSVPTTVVAGHPFTAAFAMKNTGSTVWTNASEYGLASLNAPIDRWGYSTLNKVAVPDFPGVVPCARLTFAVTASAPIAEGYYDMQWQMRGPGGYYFGQKTPIVRIHVVAPYNSDNAQQSRVQVVVPDRIRTNQVFNATVVMRNTGTTTWTQGANYYLQPLNGDSTWGVSNNLVPGTITPNNEAIFFLTITAPTLPNVYAFRWQMTRNGVPFGDPTDFMTLNVHPGGGVGNSPPVCDNPFGDRADFVAHTVPLTVVAGRYFQSAFAMRNSGSTLWKNGYDYGLASRHDPPEFWGPGTSFNPVAVPDAPGLTPCGNMTFIINTKAPDYAGDYYMQWQMRGPNGLFGQPTPLLRIRVLAAPPADDAHSAVVSVQTHPIRVGQQFQAVISMYNTGKTTWTRTGNYYLQPLNGVNLWGTSGVYVPTTIPPGFGQAATWNLTLTAPSTPGRYAFRWQMAHNYQAFGDPTDYMVIEVLPPP